MFQGLRFHCSLFIVHFLFLVPDKSLTLGTISQRFRLYQMNLEDLSKRKRKERLFLLVVVAVNLVIKTIPASFIEVGIDEVYYWTYALFPDWSHFDHPPMVGWTIQLFTLNLFFTGELFLRLAALIFSSCNIILLYYLVKRIYSVQAAVISVLLFTASVYFNIISGLFILPDTPQIFFMMLALYVGIPAVISPDPSRRDSRNMILFGFFTGLAFLSKYHSLFLWFGFGLFIILHHRQWLKKPSLYISLLVTLILMTPVIYWNINNHFISFTFHGSRVGLFTGTLDFSSFMQFNLGQFFYQNPVLSVIFILCLVSLFKNRKEKLTLPSGLISPSAHQAISTPSNLLLLYLSLPLILVFTLFSLFKDTLPHWSGPAFIALIILSSQWLSENLVVHRRRVINAIIIANALLLAVLILSPIYINKGLFSLSNEEKNPRQLGEKDLSLDMYGWKQAGDQFRIFLKKEGLQEEDYPRIKIISGKWFPGAHIDFYIAHPLHIDLLVAGTLADTHKYFWINRKRGLTPGDRIYYLTTSHQYAAPENLAWKFSSITPKDTINIQRNGRTVYKVFIWQMETDKKLP